MIKKIIVLLMLTVFLTGSSTTSNKIVEGKLLEEMIELNRWKYQKRVNVPDFGTMDFLGDGGYWSYRESTTPCSKMKETHPFGLYKTPDKPPVIPGDTLDIPKKPRKNRAKITITPHYEINDGIGYLRSFFKIGYDNYFLVDNAIKKQEKKFHGICRLNNEKWYEVVTAAKFDVTADMGKNRVLAFSHEQPLRLYGFNWSFTDDFYINLPDFRFRQEILKLTDKKFLFHNLRVSPHDYAVEIYDLSRKRLAECFNYGLYTVKTKVSNTKAGMTVLTTDKRGHFYIAFAYPPNPYRVWKFDENGKKVKVLGNYFADPEVYEFPDEYLTASFKDIKRYGIPKIYAVNKLLTDFQGRLYVFFSMNRMKKGHFNSDVQKYYIDIYSPDGDFLGRKEFKHGFPELIDNGIIYSRKKTEIHRLWDITAVKVEIK